MEDVYHVEKAEKIGLVDCYSSIEIRRFVESVLVHGED